MLSVGASSNGKFTMEMAHTRTFDSGLAIAQDDDDEEELRTIERVNQDVRRQVISKSLTSGNLDTNIVSVALNGGAL